MSGFDKCYKIYILSDDGHLKHPQDTRTYYSGEMNESFETEEDALNFLDGENWNYYNFIILPEYRRIPN